MQEDPLVGQQLGNYAIERVIGYGGMAVVYFGRDVKLNRPAAIKVISARFRSNAGYTSRFLQEARMIASWRHEHILQIYYADDAEIPGAGRVFFFAMEYIDGSNLAETLAQTIKQHGLVPPADVLRYGRAVAEALDYAHARGVIHRDVKPANILVSREGRVALSDFGLALDVEQGSIGEVFGSAHYIAPEQARRSSDAVAQSDLYSLGVILYEMLTGVVPFDDPSPTSVALQHITLPPPRPREINPELSEEVESVLLRALAKKPEDRYASGAELIAALENALIRMHPSLPTRKQIPLPAQAAQSSAPAPRPILPTLSRIPGPGSTKVKIGVAAAGLVLVIGLITVLSVQAWRAGSASPVQPTSTGGASVFLPQIGGEATAVSPAETQTAPTAADPLPTDTAAPVEPSAVVETPAPTAAEALPAPSPTWTPRYPGGRKMILMWNDSSFYMLQTTGYGELIDPLVFERLDASGVPVNRFSGKLWAEMHAATLRDWCMRLEIGGPSQPADLPPYLRPPACEEHTLATRWPVQGDATIFWTKQEGSSLFRVLWGREEIQRCEIDDGTCEVYLP